MQRREALRLLASAATLPLVSRDAFSLFQEVHQQLPQTAALKALDPYQNAIVVTISELIIPQTDTPGAKAARVNEFIDLVVVPGLGFSASGYRIGRGMGFYDRFLAQPEFLGVSCGLGFEEQIVEQLPVLDHDMPLSMLTTDRGIRRGAVSGAGGLARSPTRALSGRSRGRPRSWCRHRRSVLFRARST